MVRHKVRKDSLSAGRLLTLERPAGALERELLTAQAEVKSETPHHRAIWSLIDAIRRSFNVLNGRHPEARPVDRVPFSQATPVWFVPGGFKEKDGD